ncbi:MAG: STAS domain-containing protein [Ruminococcus sp.]|jgi:stage II sporulation protein AA (anti-sigma F factor antagonist)|nr:STAS domain-containing protein [Ruminococcus sp.]
MTEIKNNPVIIDFDGVTLTASLSGDIDHASAFSLREDIDFAIDRHLPQILMLDFSAVEFMDSSGIGLIMGRYRKLEPQGGKIVISGSKGTIRKVLIIAGIEKLAEIL